MTRLYRSVANDPVAATPYAKPSREDVARTLAHVNSDWTDGYARDDETGEEHEHSLACANWEPYLCDTDAVLALLPGRSVLWAQVDAWDEGYIAGSKRNGTTANPYHADALRADRIALADPKARPTMTEPTRINPADIRVGDRVERRYVSGDHETIERFVVKAAAHRAVSSCRLTWVIEPPRSGIAEWYLIDRPDPDAGLIERVVEAIEWFPLESTTEDDARAVLAAIRDTHDIVQRGGE